MFQLWKLLFPKLYFGIDDLPSGGGAPNGQPEPDDEGNATDPNAEPAAPSPTEDIEFEGGVKVSKEMFEKVARERYKDAFEAQTNRDKWQAENTRKAQEIAQAQRDAEAYRRLMADPEYQQRRNPNPRQTAKQEYIEDMKKDFPDLDERFLAKQFDWNMKLAEQRSREAIDPFLERQGQDYEKSFLAAHPKVVKGTPQYQEILELTQQGVDPERAYKIVFFDDLLKEKQEEAIKLRDAEAKRKLQQSRTASTAGTKTAPKTSKERFENAWEKLGYK